MKCNLNYEWLTIGEVQHRVQACLDKETSKDPNAWLEVVNWFQESMRPAGTKMSREDLDMLKTTRPIIVRSSFGHTVLVEHARAQTRKNHRPVRQTRWAARSGGTLRANPQVS